jgi:outer membrane lipopolysaccharide assembly protein LptE/RlpB
MSKPKRTFIFSCLIVLFLLTGCGFSAAPRTLNSRFATLQLQSDDSYGRFAKKMRQKLYAANVKIADAAKNAPVLHITAATFSYLESGVGISNQGRVYYATMSVAFELKDQNGNSLIDYQKLQCSKNFILAPNELITNTNQLSTVENDLEEELVFKLFHAIQMKLENETHA